MLLKKYGLFLDNPGSVDTLTLNSLYNGEADPSEASISFLRDGTVLENDVEQNSGTEWIDNNSADIGDTYEVFLTGSGDTPGALALDTWHTISETRQWLLDAGGEPSPPGLNFQGTVTVREIADPDNSVSASFEIDSQDWG